MRKERKEHRHAGSFVRSAYVHVRTHVRIRGRTLIEINLDIYSRRSRAGPDMSAIVLL